MASVRPVDLLGEMPADRLELQAAPGLVDALTTHDGGPHGTSPERGERPRAEARAIDVRR